MKTVTSPVSGVVTPDELCRAPVLVHVGLHKTGSTWLQAHLFAEGAAGFCAPWGQQSALAIGELVLADPVAFDPAQARAAFAAAASRRCGDGEVPVISHEALSSRPQRGEYYAPLIADRIRATFPEARILLVLREQRRMIYSLYGQHLRDGGRLTLPEFIGRGDEPPGWAPQCRLAFFHYDRLVGMYRQRFGEDRVLALPLELLSRDQNEFVGRILAFCNLPGRELRPAGAANPGWGPLTLGLLRRLNGVLRARPLAPAGASAYGIARRVLGRADRLVPRSLQHRREESMRAMIEARVGGEFATSNRRLSEMIGIDLAALGYVCEK